MSIGEMEVLVHLDPMDPMDHMERKARKAHRVRREREVALGQLFQHLSPMPASANDES
jgi:hypothetical protein